MKKMKFIALIAAIIAGLALYRFLIIISQPQETPRTEVVVAAADIPENTTITADMVQLQPVATEALLTNGIRDMNQVVGMVASSEILAGEQVVTDRLVLVGKAESASDTLSYVVQPGMRAATVSVSTTSGLATLLKPGNRVDVVLNYTYTVTTDQGEKEIPASRLLMEDIGVLAVDSTMSRAGVTADVGYTTVTLLVTPEQAVELSYSEYAANLRLILRSPLDTDRVGDTMITLDDIQK